MARGIFGRHKHDCKVIRITHRDYFMISSDASDISCKCDCGKIRCFSVPGTYEMSDFEGDLYY